MKEEKEEEKTTKKSHLFLNLVILLGILIFGIYLYASYVEPRKLVVKEYKIESSSIPLNFSGVKIIHIGDIYYGNTTHKSEVKKLVEKVNVLKPDIVVFTGNLISESNKMTEEEKTDLISMLKSIDVSLGKYAVKGKIDKDYFDVIMSTAEFKVLNNEYELIYNSSIQPIFLVGLDSNNPDISLPFSYFSEGIDTSIYKIVLVNEGDTTDKIIENNIKTDLILSGNSLNGTINIPYYGPLFLPNGSKKYYLPHYKKDNTDVYITSGVGTNKYPYRLNNAPSFNLYRLKSLQ